MEGDKIMRLNSQTAKIEGGFVHFPEKAHWLDTYIKELTSFPNSKYDDQVDSTVLRWLGAPHQDDLDMMAACFGSQGSKPLHQAALAAA